MSKSESAADVIESPAVSETAYYECEPCEYRSLAAASIPMCPRCGERISEPSMY